MNQKIAVFFALTSLASLSSCWMLPVDESCYYKVTLNYEALGTRPALEVSGDVMHRVFNDYKADRREVPPIGKNNLFLFADTCDLPSNEQRQKEIFRLGPELYVIEKIKPEQYLEYSETGRLKPSETTP